MMCYAQKALLDKENAYFRWGVKEVTGKLGRKIENKETFVSSDCRERTKCGGNSR